jgi:polysaccharide export outer membrane protein
LLLTIGSILGIEIRTVDLKKTTKSMMAYKLTANTSMMLLAACIIGIFSSCVNVEKATYFNFVKSSDIQVALDSLEPVIQKNDLLSITISSPNPQATQIFNTSNNVSSNLTSNQLTGYLVSQDGFVELPMIGLIRAAGLTKKQLKETITRTIIQSQFLKDPIVTVRYLNYTVTVLGEVAHPTVINVSDERLSLLKALGYAGDMTMFAQRNTVMIIREEDGKRMVRRLNLNSEELLTSPYYYLKSNDIVYVEPNKARVSSTSNVRGWMPIIISTISLAIVVLYRIVR